MNRITGIGSLPHHNVDAAIQHSFSYDIPYLPQIPIKNPAEYMIPQALEGIPGVDFDKEGMVSIDEKKLQKGFAKFLGDVTEVLEGKSTWQFSVESFSAWKAFLFELSEKKSSMAKIQITGPLTTQWLVSNKNLLKSGLDLGMLIFHLITAKSMSMTQKLVTSGVQPLLFLDEPGLFAYNSTNPKHLLCVQELRLMITALKKSGALVGLHCCSNTDWKMVFGLGLSYVSFDVSLSFDEVFLQKRALIEYLEKGGSLSLGIIPTNKGEAIPAAGLIVEDLLKRVKRELTSDSMTVNQILKHSLLTPACGLALKPVEEAEKILSHLKQCRDALNQLA